MDTNVSRLLLLVLAIVTAVGFFIWLRSLQPKRKPSVRVYLLYSGRHRWNVYVDNRWETWLLDYAHPRELPFTEENVHGTIAFQGNQYRFVGFGKGLTLRVITIKN